MSGRTDWRALMRVGLGRLRLAPETFWAMTPVEFAAAVEGLTGAAATAAPLGRARLEALMAAHPDEGRAT